MATYQVTGSKKNDDDDIIGLCGAWGSAQKSTVIQMLGDGHVFSVSVGGRTVSVRAAIRNGSYYLTTKADGFKPNNLDDLPDC